MRKNVIYIIAAILSPVALVAQSIVPNGTTAPQLSLPATPSAYNPSAKINMVRTWEARKAVTDTSATSLNNNTSFKTATAYFDGFGRPLQTVVKGNNYDGTKDIVSMNIYDEFGRESKQYLPYAPATGSIGKFRLNPFAEQQAFYNANYNDQTPFGKTEYEASPLGRTLKTFAPGNSWAGANRSVQSDFAVNTPEDDVKTASIAFGSGVKPAFAGPYPAGQLIKYITLDEHGKKIIEYKNKSGQVILKKVQLADVPGGSYNGWISTYYVYDDYGQLRYVVQPKGVEWLIANGWSFSASGGTQVSEELCFIYEYDADGRLIYNKVPGSAPVLMCYDKRDRLVYSQDGNLRNINQWMVTFYDELNRQISTALYNTTLTQAQIQASLDMLETNNPVPTLAENSLTRLSYTYYDEYTMPGAQVFNESFKTIVQADLNPGDEITENLNVATLTRGMVTGIKMRVIGTNTFLNTTTWYDTKGKPLQTSSSNLKGGTDVITMAYSFTGKVLSSYMMHNNPAALLPGTQSTQIFTRNTYNNDYLLKTEKKVNQENWRRIAEIQYDDMGRPKKKMMGNPASNFYVDMDYNIRGWLTGINKAAQQNLENGSIAVNTFYSAIFSEILHYDYGYNKQNYNGNISGIKWANASDKMTRSFGFEYDNLSRLKAADFNQKYDLQWSKAAGIDYSLPEMTYDANGNILTLRQLALKLNTSNTVDMLDYSYLPNSNKLMRVTESAPGSTPPGEAAGLGDFKDGTNTGDDYAFDVNGSMIQDNNKNISSITYNHLNLPQTITLPGKGTIRYIYDAVGNKLQKEVKEDTKTTITDYISGFVYQNNELQFTGHEEGRIRYAKKYFLSGDSAYTWQYDYFYKDHLGSIRAVVTEQQDTSKYMATFETANREKESHLFTNIDETAFEIALVNKTNLNSTCSECILTVAGTNYPQDNTTQPNHYTSRLNGEGKRIGAAITLKVMAGDKVDLGTKVWYPESEIEGLPEAGNPEEVLPSLINTLSGNASGLSGGKASSAELSNTNSPLWAGIQFFLNTHTEDENNSGNPKAYLNWILFDEQFKYVPDGSGFIPVPGFSNDIQTLANSNIPVSKSGYLFVYLSNETRKRDVFFDNLVVQHYTGPLSETNDYTVWGLSMRMLESKAFGRMENKSKYNGIEYNSDLSLETYEAMYRNLDPQVGRWWSIDPKPNMAISPYSSMDNNPIRYSDPLGDTIRHTFRRGFLGLFGKKVTIDYANGQYLNAGTNTLYTGKLRKYQRALLTDLTTLTNNVVTSGMTNDLVNSTRVIQIKNGGSDQNGGASFDGPAAAANPGAPLIVNYSVGKTIDMTDVNQGNSSVKLPGFVALAHEFAHVQDWITNNTANFTVGTAWFTSAIDGRSVARSEILATHLENRLRANLRLPLREWYEADKSRSITNGRILRSGTRENANTSIINNGNNINGNPIPFIY